MRKLCLILALCLPVAFASEPEPETRDLWIYTDVDEDSGEAQVYASESPHVFQSQDLRIEGQRKHMSLRRKARHEVMLESRSGRYQHAIWKVAELEGSLAVALHGLRVELEAVFAGEELVVENLPGVAPVSVSGELFYGGSPVYALEGNERRSARLVVNEVDWAVHGWSEQLSNSVGLGAAQADSAVEVTLRGWTLKHEQVFVFDELLARARSGPLASSSGESIGGPSREGSDDEAGLVWVKQQRSLGGADPDGFGVATSSAGSAAGLLARPATETQSAAGSSLIGTENSQGATGSSTAGATSNSALNPSASQSSTPVAPGDLAFTTPAGAPLALPGETPGSASPVSAGPGTTVAARGASGVGSSGGTPVSGVTAGTSAIVPPSLGSGGVSGSATGSSVTTVQPTTPPTVGIVGALGR